MIRQRVNLRTPLAAYVVRALTVLFALALVWYGLMVILLAVKVAPHTVNSISAYRSLYDDVAGLGPDDFTTSVRLIAGFAALLAFLIFLYLAFEALPRPYLARGEVTLERDARGHTVIKPRAIERAAERAALDHPDVTSAAGRLGDQELNIAISTRRTRTVAETLTDVHQRVAADFERHELPRLPLNVTLTGYDPTTRRELS